MLLIDKLAERYIVEAQKRGEFDGLPGQGKPLALDDDRLVPPDLRAGYRLLKNAGCLPQELSLISEIRDAGQLIAAAQTEMDVARANKRLRYLLLQLETVGGRAGEILASQYGEKIAARSNPKE